MNKLKIQIPDGIDRMKPRTITQEKIFEYYTKIKEHFGEFCGDCRNISEDGTAICQKKHKPRKYQMEIGPYEFAVLKKDCKDFVIDDAHDLDYDAIKRGTGIALDCNSQQYV